MTLMWAACTLTAIACVAIMILDEHAHRRELRRLRQEFQQTIAFKPAGAVSHSGAAAGVTPSRRTPAEAPSGTGDAGQPSWRRERMLDWRRDYDRGEL